MKLIAEHLTALAPPIAGRPEITRSPSPSARHGRRTGPPIVRNSRRTPVRHPGVSRSRRIGVLCYRIRGNRPAENATNEGCFLARTLDKHNTAFYIYSPPTFSHPYIRNFQSQKEVTHTGTIGTPFHRSYRNAPFLLISTRSQRMAGGSPCYLVFTSWCGFIEQML